MDSVREKRTDNVVETTSHRETPVTTFGSGTEFRGVLRFKDALKIKGRFNGTIEATGPLVVDKGAQVEADRIQVTSLTVSGTVVGAVRAVDTVELLAGSIMRGDISATRLRIADGVLFDGKCSMTAVNEDVEIFSRPTEEIKAELLRRPSE